MKITYFILWAPKMVCFRTIILLMLLKFCIVTVWHTVIFMLKKFWKIRWPCCAASCPPQTMPSAPTLLLSLLSILKDKKVLTWISSSTPSRHRHTKAFAVTRGWDHIELFLELLCCTEVSQTLQIEMDKALRCRIILS